MNRLLGIVVTGLWVVAMAALVRRDVIPFWIADTAPPSFADVGDTQVGIFDDRGQRVGTSWITTLQAPIRAVQSTTQFKLTGALGKLPQINNIILDNTLTYGDDEQLVQFSFALFGAPWRIHISGERYGRDFACTAQIGEMSHTMQLDARLSGHLSESLRPFTHLRGLSVGQSWRIRLLDPMALVRDRSIEFQIQIARVTGRDVIDHRGRQVECHRIETEGSTAWADETGRILRQEVEAPLMGKWILLDEPFDERSRAAARAIVNRG